MGGRVKKFKGRLWISPLILIIDNSVVAIEELISFGDSTNSRTKDNNTITESTQQATVNDIEDAISICKDSKSCNTCPDGQTGNSDGVKRRRYR